MAAAPKKTKKTDEPKKEVAKKDDAKNDDAPVVAEGEAAAAPKRKKRNARHVPEGRAYIQATYNNTIITLTDPLGKVITWGSAGVSGFKGTRKATPYAASVAAESVVKNAKSYGLERVHVYLSGVGSGREQSVRSLQASGLIVLSITDTTPIAHNGVRRPRVRRV